MSDGEYASAAAAPKNGKVVIQWEALAMWFGRGLFVIALYMGQQLLAKVDALTEAHLKQAALLDTMNRELHARTSLRWTQIDQKLWATLLAQQNPKIIVPEPVHVPLANGE